MDKDYLRYKEQYEKLTISQLIYEVDRAGNKYWHAVVEVLVEKGDESVIPSIMRAIKGHRFPHQQKEREISKEALVKIVKRIGEEAIKLMIAYVREKRGEAQWVLKKIGAPAVGPLMEEIREEITRLRKAAAENPKKFVFMSDSQLDSYKWVREGIVNFVSFGIGKPAVEPLIEYLKDEEQLIRRRAARALGNIKDKRAIEPLKSLLSDSNEKVAKEAVPEGFVAITVRV